MPAEQEALESFRELVQPSTALLFPTLCSHGFSAWLFHGERIGFVWLWFFSQQCLRAVECNTFLCGCADTMDRTLRADGPAQPESGSLMLWAGEGDKCCPTPAGLWAADVSILENVKCLLIGALGSGQHHAEPSPAIALCPHHSTAQLCSFLPCRGQHETPPQQNQFIPLVKAATRREKWEENQT